MQTGYGQSCTGDPSVAEDQAIKGLCVVTVMLSALVGVPARLAQENHPAGQIVGTGGTPATRPAEEESGTSSPALSPKEIVEKTREGIVLLDTRTVGDLVGQGTGFLITQFRGADNVRDAVVD